jgi:uncharacterized membrane protein YphA (DoxX/SURF4 family)
MTPADLPASKRPALERMAVLARWFLGACFLYMGLKKALEPYDFLEIVREYGVVANPFVLNSIAALLPWFEAFCGLLLIAGVAVRGSALVLIAMLVPCTVLVVRRGLVIAAAQHLPFCGVKSDSGCGNGETFTCHKLVENTGLLLLPCWLLCARSGRLCRRFNLLGDDN